MATFDTPGVYVLDVPPLARPIEGVSTSTAGIVGVSADIAPAGMPPKPGGGQYTQKPAGEWQLVTGWTEFTQWFGEIKEENKYLAHAVYGFFNNGGTRCYVARVAKLDDVTAALAGLAAIDEVAIVAAPMPPKVGTADVTAADLNAKVHVPVLTHCAKCGDRFAILEGTEKVKSLTVSTDDAGIFRPSNGDGFGAFYFPWVVVPDPVGKATLAVPPSGHLAGVYARTDGRRGVFKAPANEEILGTTGVNRPLSDADQGALNLAAVNCIRDFRGQILVWGGRTLAAAAGGKPEWKYVNVRRFLIFLRETIQTNLRWAVFEPNTPGLWKRIVRSVSDFLLLQWQAGALFGDDPKQAFFVKCDHETNNSAVREAGMVVTRIGVAVVKPAEFVIFEIEQTTGG